MKAFGEHLLQAREAAGLTLEEIHQRTRISRKNLQLLEAGDFPSIPQTYVRAFVREYARMVGLDEDETLALYNEQAERDRGIPPPPSAIDSSNLLPRIDDSVEFIPYSDHSASHVEVDGTAEAVDDEFVPNIRKSSYVSDSSASPIDIRTTYSASQKPLPGGTEKTESAGHATEKEEQEQTQTAPASLDPAAAATAHAPGPSDATTRDIPAETGDTSHPKAETPPVATHTPEPPVAPASKVPEKAPTPAEAKTPHKKPVSPTATPSPVSAASVSSGSTVEPVKHAADQPPRPSVYDTKPPIENARRYTEDAEEKARERRIMGVGFVVVAMIAVAAYGIYFFSFRSDSGDSTIDSTAIKASIEAGRFIDSTQAALTEMELPPDTLPVDTRIPPEPVETKTTVYARDDSLVLEAFTSAPVWFSVKMDTLRTERGSLSSNEHRTWKAREFFVVTLGDAGAVTFFLNGREIGTLGDEGSVVKNVVLSRSRIRGN